MSIDDLKKNYKLECKLQIYIIMFSKIPAHIIVE